MLRLMQVIDLGADSPDRRCPAVGEPETGARMREIGVMRRDLFPPLDQQGRDPRGIADIDRPRETNKSAKISRSVYRYDA